MPPFNLSCQVRIRCFYICGEWAVEVQLDCWGQLLCTAATLKPFWSSHASFGSSLDLPTHFGWLLSAFIVLQEFLVQEDCPLAFHLDLKPAAGAAMHLLNPPLSLCSSLEWGKRQFVLASALPPSNPVYSWKDVSFTNRSQMNTCPLVIKGIVWITYSGWGAACLKLQEAAGVQE